MNNKTIFLIVFSCCLFACNKKESLPENGIIDIAPAFQPFVDQFMTEATARGTPIDFSDTGLSMQFSALPLGTAAQCQELGDDRTGSHQILFDENLWAIAAPQRKEFLVFHELGHCELGRQHINTKLPNGEWKSMMQGNITNMPLTEKEQGRPVNFYGFRKDYYLDELFGTTTNIPTWSNFTNDYMAIPINEKMSLFDTINTTILQENFDLPTTNFEIEISTKISQGIEEIGLKYGTLANAYLFKWTDKGEVVIELTGQVPNEIDFFNGGSLLLARPYRLYFCNDLFLSDQELRLTIRQQNGIASFFLNEAFLYQVDAFNDTSILVGAIPTTDDLLIDYFSLSAL